MACDIQYVEEIAKRAVSDMAGIDEAIISPDSTLEELTLDSLDIVELISNLEGELGVKFGYKFREISAKGMTFGQLVRGICD